MVAAFQTPFIPQTGILAPGFTLDLGQRSGVCATAACHLPWAVELEHVSTGNTPANSWRKRSFATLIALSQWPTSCSELNVLGKSFLCVVRHCEVIRKLHHKCCYDVVFCVGSHGSILFLLMQVRGSGVLYTRPSAGWPDLGPRDPGGSLLLQPVLLFQRHLLLGSLWSWFWRWRLVLVCGSPVL